MADETPEWLKVVLEHEPVETSPAPVVEHDADLVPDIEVIVYPPDPRLEELKAIDLWEGIQRITPGIKSKKNGNFQCPHPLHGEGRGDDDPSANITKKNDQVWCCYFCPPSPGQRGQYYGGDLITYAACRWGYGPDSYQSGSEFSRLIDELSVFFGITVTRTLAGPSVVRSVEPDPGPPVTPSTSKPGSASGDPATFPAESPPEPETRHLRIVEPDEFDWGTVKVDYPEIDYSVIRTPGTFIDSCLSLAERLNYTQAHFLFTAFAGVSLAVRRHFMAADEPPVRSNLYVVLLGESGSTKTKAQALFIRMMKQAFPEDDPDLGVRLFVPISGENIVSNMAVDPSAGSVDNPGCIITNEYARLAKIMERSGSTMETYLQDFFDNDEKVVHKNGTAFNHHLCMVTTTQPDMVKDHLTKEHVQSGYANRLLFSYGPPGVPDEWNETVEISDQVKLLQAIYAFYKFKNFRVTLESDARDYWKAFFRDQITPDKRTSTRLLTRSDLLIKKLFLLFAANEHSETITLHHVEQACSLYEYLKKSAEFVQGKVGFGEHEDCHDDIRDYLLKKPRSPVRRLEPTMRKRGHKYKTTMATLHMMADLGEVGVEKHGYVHLYSLSDMMKVPAAAAPALPRARK